MNDTLNQIKGLCTVATSVVSEPVVLECLKKIEEITKGMEVEWGPERGKVGLGE